tara:strand:+ start:5216 stop:5410 length:195 start_codon:yes stop_codon:yes gene_type:complete
MKIKLYKFTFYGVSPYWLNREPKLKKILKEIEESLSYVDELNQVTTVQAVEQDVRDVAVDVSVD